VFIQMLLILLQTFTYIHSTRLYFALA
jgi:hypothetical protein